MTEQEFLALHTTETGYNINTKWRINVNYDTNPPREPGFTLPPPNTVIAAIPHYITGITVTRKARQVDGDDNVDMNGILQGIDKIRFTFDGYDYSLDIISRAYFHNPSGFPYYYFRVIPFEIPTQALIGLTDPEEQYNVRIDFSPFISELLEYYLSLAATSGGVLSTSPAIEAKNLPLFLDYNPTYSNVQRSRKSYKIVVSDRNQDAAIPTNFNAIYNGTAEYAEVLDSIYYDTGWINGRYQGTKTSADDYSGLTPSIAGKSFEGEVYSADAAYETFCIIESDNRVYEDLFHTGLNTLPQFTSSSLGIYLPTILTTGTTTIPYVSGSSITGSVEVGDILLIDQEKMRVTSLQPLATPYPTFTVVRGYVGTSDVPHTATTEISKITRTDLFRFTTSRAKTSILDNSIVYVRESNIALYTDAYGTVFNSVTCSATP